MSFIADANNIVCTYDTPGTHRATVKVFDVVEEQTVIVYAATHTFHGDDVSALGRTIRGVYSGMLGRLRDGNIDAAVNAFVSERRDEYRNIFSTLGSDLPAAVDQMGELRTLNIRGGAVEIAIARRAGDADEVYLLGLQYGDDGIWRIDSM